MKAPLILRKISEFTVYIHFSKLDVERFSIECCKAKSWVITATNQKKGRYRKQPIRSQSCLKRGKRKVTKIRLILHLYLFGWEDCVRCINQSRCKVKKTNLILVYFRHLMETLKEVNLLSFVNFRCRFRSAYLSYLIADCEPDPGFPRITSWMLGYSWIDLWGYIFQRNAEELQWWLFTR